MDFPPDGRPLLLCHTPRSEVASLEQQVKLGSHAAARAAEGLLNDYSEQETRSVFSKFGKFHL